MEHGIVHKLTPEQEELEKKKLELAALETELAENELNLATFQAELNAFEQTELFQLKNKVIEAKDLGQDLLAKMANELDKQINAAMKKLEELKTELNL